MRKGENKKKKQVYSVGRTPCNDGEKGLNVIPMLSAHARFAHAHVARVRRRQEFVFPAVYGGEMFAARMTSIHCRRSARTFIFGVDCGTHIIRNGRRRREPSASTRETIVPMTRAKKNHEMLKQNESESFFHSVLCTRTWPRKKHVTAETI
mgnify:CR=1 FL=1